MPRNDDIGEVRFEKRTQIVMIHREPYNNSNDVNGGKPYKDRVTELTATVHKLPDMCVSDEIKKVLAE